MSAVLLVYAVLTERVSVAGEAAPRERRVRTLLTRYAVQRADQQAREEALAVALADHPHLAGEVKLEIEVQGV